MIKKRLPATALTLFVLLVAGPTAQAQRYPDSDPHSPNFQQWNAQQNEQAQQRQRSQEAAERQRAEESARIFGEGLSTFMENQRRLQEKISNDVERDRALFLKTPPLPPQKNLLLGQWRLVMPKKKSGNAIADFNAMMAGGACEGVFGEGIWDFRPAALYGMDAGIGETKLTDVAYHGNEGLVGVIPKLGKLFNFKILAPDRAQELTSTRIGVEPCNFVRVGAGRGAGVAAAPSTNASAPGGASSASGLGPAAPPAQVATAAPTRSTLSRPSPEVCRQTLLDKLGTVGVNQVRAMSDVRFKEAAIEGKVPNSNNLRIDLRGSACDDPRIKATLYDFDADGMLQAITYVWERPAGPAPAPIFQERANTLSVLHPGLPQPQSPGRLQADTSLGRLVLQDLPERNLLLEAYATKK